MGFLSPHLISSPFHSLLDTFSHTHPTKLTEGTCLGRWKNEARRHEEFLQSQKAVLPVCDKKAPRWELFSSSYLQKEYKN